LTVGFFACANGIHKDIDFTRKPEIKSNELRCIIPRAKMGRRNADVWVKVYLKDGTRRCIMVLSGEDEKYKLKGFHIRDYLFGMVMRVMVSIPFKILSPW
jgi:hypothetical protein